MANGMLNALLLYVSIHVGKACFSSGICSGGYGCPQPVAPVCSGGCAPGYGCGQYGCYSRARARSSKILGDAVFDKSRNSAAAVAAATDQVAAKRQESNTKQMADELFYECCVNQHLPDSCLDKCSYSTYTRNTLQAIYLHFDRCPLSALTDISYCAASGTDHTECCIRNDVTTTLAGRKCLIFCDQRPGNVTQLDLSYLPCYERFENIKMCFMEHIRSRNKPEIVDVRLARTFET
ncbi:unnamed protein product [Onchocerca ochengi]|uniref:DB domain-containing protein n=2 Tax=Onchocerca TaxID=6281 RepID=A0A2K6VZ85_ONCVO|nr:unnamed protein product [Onchocerca ochengi]